jgi:RNA polymerase sigma-70 factor (ECF subfamily)
MRDSTEIGGPNFAFPTTSWSVVRSAIDPASPERRTSLESLLKKYWKPVYRFVRARWRKSNEDAKDLTQGFFALLLEGQGLLRVAPEHGSLRSYLKTALAHFLVDEQRKEEALKRGGSFDRVPVDISTLDGAIADDGTASPEEAFDREWLSVCLGEAVRALQELLRAEGREAYFDVFSAYYLDPQNPSRAGAPITQDKEAAPTYESVASRLGLRPHDVSNYLVYARRKLRNVLKQRVSDYVSSEQDAAAELRFILGD